MGSDNYYRSRGSFGSFGDDRHDVDVLIIGGGCAGIAAAEKLLTSSEDVSVALLEARSDLGGRVCSVDYRKDMDMGKLGGKRVDRFLQMSNKPGLSMNFNATKSSSHDDPEEEDENVSAESQFANFPTELGGEMVHGYNGSLGKLVPEDLGLPLVDTMDQKCDALIETGRNHDSIHEVGEFALESDLGDAFHRIEVLENLFEEAREEGWLVEGEEDMSLKSFFAQEELPQEKWPMLCYFTAREYGATLENFSAYGASENWDLWSCGNEDSLLSRTDWQGGAMGSVIRRTHPTFFKHLQASTDELVDASCDNVSRLQVRTSCPVAEIDDRIDENSTNNVVLVTEANTGKVWRARKVIVTIPLSMLKKSVNSEERGIRILPCLPQDKIAAINNMGMGVGGKLIIRLKKRLWEKEVCCIATDKFGSQIWISSYGKDVKNGDEATGIITLLVASAHMRDKLNELTDCGHEWLLTYLNDTFLSFLFGEQTERVVQSAIWVDWSSEPYVEGLYSFPHVNGKMADREILARPEFEDKLHFAGEHTERIYYGSIHGAMDSGTRAATQCLKTFEKSFLTDLENF